MSDTVTKLMALADAYTQAFHKNMQETGNWYAYGRQRQALKDELVRLFTPLRDEQIATVYFGATEQSLRPQDNVLAHKFARAIEFQHGITGESNGT